jgi:acetyltransferase-like isoleucine patch superfamily enzyme
MNDAVIHPTAEIGEGCRSGSSAVLMEGVQLGRYVTLGHNVVVHPGTILADGITVGDNSVVDRLPKLAKTSTIAGSVDLPSLQVGSGATVGSGAVLYVGTHIGQDCLIADQASIREKCTIGDAVSIGRGVTVENDTTIGSYTQIQSRAHITAWMTIEDHVFVAPCVVTNNDDFMGQTAERFKYRKGPSIRRGARLEANAMLLQGITIGREAFVAAGSVVTRDVAYEMLVMGSPAREVQEVPERELVESGR